MRHVETEGKNMYPMVLQRALYFKGRCWIQLWPEWLVSKLMWTRWTWGKSGRFLQWTLLFNTRKSLSMYYITKEIATWLTGMVSLKSRGIGIEKHVPRSIPRTGSGFWSLGSFVHTFFVLGKSFWGFISILYHLSWNVFPFQSSACLEFYTVQRSDKYHRFSHGKEREREREKVNTTSFSRVCASRYV